MDLFWRSALIENVLLFKFLGIYLLLGTTGDSARAGRTGLLTGAGILLTALGAWVLQHMVLGPLALESLLPWALALLALAVAMMLRKVFLPGKDLWRAQLANTAVLGVALLVATQSPDPLSALLLSLGGALGLIAVLLLVGGLMEATESHWIPVPFRGAPIRLITAGLLGLGFMGFRLPL